MEQEVHNEIWKHRIESLAWMVIWRILEKPKSVFDVDLVFSFDKLQML